MNTSTITLTFSETMDVSTLDVAGITIQDAQTALVSYALDDSASASPDGTTVVIDLSTHDFNAIAHTPHLAKSWDTSWLTIAVTAIQNMTGTNVDPIADGSALQASTYISDATAPTLTFVHISSNNTDSASAKVGNNVTIFCIANEPLNATTVSVLIDGNAASVVGDGLYWNASYVMQQADIDGIVGFAINFSDIANNPGTQVTNVTDASFVIFDKTPPTSSVDAIIPYWWSTQMTVIANADDGGVGVNNVTLYYCFSVNNITFGGWVSNGTEERLPGNWTFLFENGTGYYRFMSVATDLLGNVEIKGTADAMCGYETGAPISKVEAIVPYWQTGSPLTITATASNGLSGVKNVTLYYRFCDDNSSWISGWVNAGVATVSPWSWSVTPANGSGYYQFYSIARDQAGNSESVPGSADASCGFDTVAPASWVDSIALYWHKASPMTVSATASDAGSGVKNVTLYYRFSGNNDSWGRWVSAGVDAVSPWSWSCGFSNGSGYYQFYSIAQDNATNTEVIPAGADAWCGYDSAAPFSAVATISPYWIATSPLTVTVTASDSPSGLKNVTLYYYNSTDNSTWTGPWMYGSTNTSPWMTPLQWSFSFPNATGYYRFFSLAYDNMTNREILTGNDTACGYDAIAPETSMTALPAYTSTNFTVHWSAIEVDSGVATWTVEYKENASGTWTPWYTNVSHILQSAVWYIENTTANCTVYFTALAVDNASNCGAWTPPIHTTQDNAPSIPSGPSPINGTTFSEGNRPSTLSWTGGDVNNDSVNYTVYLRAGSSVLTASDIQGYTDNVTSYSKVFDWSTTYYWKIIATDGHGLNTSGPIWHFTTGALGAGGGSGPGTGPLDTSIPVPKPGGPYHGTVNTVLHFDGSASYDADTSIVRYDWRFSSTDAWHNNSGATPTHTYDTAGTYGVTLRVFDGGGNVGTNATTAIISVEAVNQPPATPMITGPTIGVKNTPYTFSIVSIDSEGDSIRYHVDWGDGTLNTSSMIDSNSVYTLAHTWTANNVFTIRVYAEDEHNASSESTIISMAINSTAVQGYGYCIDTNGDGFPDSFYCNSTGQTTPMERQSNGTYLLDLNGDAAWDHRYDPVTNTIVAYSPLLTVSQHQQNDNPWLFLGIVALAAVIIGLIVWLYKTGRI